MAITLRDGVTMKTQLFQNQKSQNLYNQLHNIINSGVRCSVRTKKSVKNGKKVAKTAILEFGFGTPESNSKKFVRYFIVQELKKKPTIVHTTP